jgi:hypothetical protein|tara:strand:- start:2316 stop:2510 length:195 start_codon:yes stop_codon:yes gene_type:complete
MLERPASAKIKHFVALERIRQSGLINMWGASEPLRHVFPDLTAKQSTDILLYWMENYDTLTETR